MKQRAFPYFAMLVLALWLPAACETEAARPGLYLCSGEPRVFQPLLADQREAQLRVAYVSLGDLGNFTDLGFGGDLPILHWHDRSLDHGISLSIRGLITARFNFLSESFDLYNNDFIGGLACGWRFKNFETEVFLHHQSSHLGDEVLAQNLAQRIDYSRETIRVLLAKTFAQTRFYAGGSEHLRADPPYMNKRFWIQTGAETEFPIHNRTMFAAVDCKVKQENGWYPNSDLQIGGALLMHKSPREGQRLYVEWFHGYSEMGQFFFRKENSFALGFGYNFK